MPTAATVGEAPVSRSSEPAARNAGAEVTAASRPATSRAAVTLVFISCRRPDPWARATRMLTDAPRAPSVSTRMKTRLLANPTAAMAVAPRAPTTTWLTKFSTSMKTNSRLTGTAILAISRRGETGPPSGRRSLRGSGSAPAVDGAGGRRASPGTGGRAGKAWRCPSRREGWGAGRQGDRPVPVDRDQTPEAATSLVVAPGDQPVAPGMRDAGPGRASYGVARGRSGPFAAGCGTVSR